jgi:hypothetical protein
MKKAVILFVTIIFTVTIAAAQTNWIDYKGDEHVTVKFPSQPKVAAPGSVFASDSARTVYIFSVVDYLQIAKMDSTALAGVKDLPDFAVGLKKGYVGSNPDVKIDDFKIGKSNGLTSYATSGTDSKNRLWDIFIFIRGHNLYGLQTIRPNGTAATGRDNFFNSVTVR